MQPCRTASRRLTAVQVGVARPRFINPPFPPPLVPRSPRWFSRLALLTSLFPPPPPPPIPLALCPPPWGIYVMLANNKLLLGPSGGGCGSVVMWGGGDAPGHLSHHNHPMGGVSLSRSLLAPRAPHLGHLLCPRCPLVTTVDRSSADSGGNCETLLLSSFWCGRPPSGLQSMH